MGNIRSYEMMFLRNGAGHIHWAMGASRPLEESGFQAGVVGVLVDLWESRDYRPWGLFKRAARIPANQHGFKIPIVGRE